MATDLETMTIAAQDQVLAVISTTQSAVLDGVRTLSKSFAGPMSKLPAFPGLDGVPSPARSVELGFDFAAKLMAAQREFTLGIVSATAPMTMPAKPAKAKA